MLVITQQLSLPLSDIQITQIRAQGAGGQNVNKVASAVHLRFDILSSSLPDQIKYKLQRSTDSRVTKNAEIVIKSQNHRTFERNKEEALQRLAALIRTALRGKKKRKPTRPSKASRQRRLDSKTRRGKVKSLRKKIT